MIKHAKPMSLLARAITLTRLRLAEKDSTPRRLFDAHKSDLEQDLTTLHKAPIPFQGGFFGLVFGAFICAMSQDTLLPYTFTHAASLACSQTSSATAFRLLSACDSIYSTIDISKMDDAALTKLYPQNPDSLGPKATALVLRFRNAKKAGEKNLAATPQEMLDFSARNKIAMTNDAREQNSARVTTLGRALQETLPKTSDEDQAIAPLLSKSRSVGISGGNQIEQIIVQAKKHHIDTWRRGDLTRANGDKLRGQEAALRHVILEQDQTNFHRWLLCFWVIQVIIGALAAKPALRITSTLKYQKDGLRAAHGYFELSKTATPRKPCRDSSKRL